MKASDLFVKCLEAEGVEHIFGLPGEENADMMMSLMDSGIDFVLCRHEQVAAFMADVYGRLTGRAGVCLATLGPGATNLVTGVADGNMDRAPMVVLTGQADTQRLHKESHQNMDVVAMFEPVTKWGFGIIHSTNVPEVVRKAFKVAQSEKPGACHIELPEDIAKIDTGSLAPLTPRRVRRPGADHKAVKEALELLKAAKNPIVLAGNGSIRKRAAKQLAAFAERTGIGVVSTFMGKGVIPRDDPHCLFTMGLQSRDHVSCFMDEADLVLAVGYDLVEYHPQFWNRGAEKKVIHLDFEPAEVDADYDPNVELVADIADSLWALNEGLGEGEPLHDVGKYADFRATMVADLEEHKDDDTEGSIRPQKALYDVRQVMGPEDIVLSDVGAHKMWVGRYYQCDTPNTCLISNGFCSMGFALPGAMAAKMVFPERRVLGVCGDAGVLMNIQDLETAVRRKLNFVLLVWEDKEYGLIKWKQQNHFDGRHSDLEFGNPDWVKLAEAFGCFGARVENARDLKPTLESAFNQDRPALIVMPVDYSENRKLTERLGSITCKL